MVHEALEREPAHRASFLTAACGGDEALQRDVESLLAHDGDASFLSTPALAAAEPRALVSGQQLGPSVVTGSLGQGGMGEVYRARDTKPGRDVAIKVLPIFTSDPERLARFAREARLLASLNHPNIGAIYGLEDVDGVPALILELIEDETLDEKIRHGSGLKADGSTTKRSALSHQPSRGLPLNDALTIARQIADALDTAHERGIVHRDLKPANIMIRDLTVKVLETGQPAWPIETRVIEHTLPSPPPARRASPLPSRSGRCRD